MNALNKFIADLNEGQKKLLMIAVVIVVAAFFDRLLIAPTMSRLSAIEEDITKEEASIRQDIRFLGYKDRIIKESQEIKPYLTAHVLTDNEMIAAFLNKIQNLAGQAKITLIKINPAPAQQESADFKYQADLECSGDIASLITFMHLVNSDKELMRVDKFNFNARKLDTDEIRASMTVEKIAVLDKTIPPKAQDANVPPSHALTTP